MQHGEQYLIRQRILKFLGAAFHIHSSTGALVGYCRQKAFRFKEDLRIYRSESCREEIMLIKARNIIDFGATYEVRLPDGIELGSFRRKGFTSSFMRAHWMVADEHGREVGELLEEGGALPVLRRLLGPLCLLFPETVVLSRLDDGSSVARFRTTRSLFTRSIGVSIEQEDPQLDELLILAAGCLLCAFEKRDRS
ncbi:MAG: hypothetical protein VX641_07010 [Planctomycetota bacterium]|nr:hypothetical protein [Planctomycetota bacterium]